MRFLRYLFMALGTAILIGLVRNIGIDVIVTHIADFGWWSGALIALAAVWNWCYAKAWQHTLVDTRNVPTWEMFRFKVAGEAINTINPANFIGGDPVRIILLKRYLPTSHSVASVVIDRTLHSIASLLIIVSGIVLAYWKIPTLPDNLRYGLPLALCAVTVFMAWIFLHQRNGLFTFLLGIAKRWRKHIKPETFQKAEDLDNKIAKFYTQDARSFWIALSYHIVGRALGAVEIFLVGYILHPHFDWSTAWILISLGSLVNMVFSFIPGALGVMEGAYGAALFLMGYPTALGLTIQVFKRLRTIVWIGIGFVFLSTQERKQLWKADQDSTTTYLSSSAANNRR